MSLSCTVSEIRYDTIRYSIFTCAQKLTRLSSVILNLQMQRFHARVDAHVWMHIINRCEMHDSDFDVLITTTFRYKRCNVHHYRACLKRQTRTVTHCHVRFVNQSHYTHCVLESTRCTAKPSVSPPGILMF